VLVALQVGGARVLVVVANLTQALVQQYAPREMTGRMMSLYTLGTTGTAPLGGLLIGWVMDAASSRAAVRRVRAAPWPSSAPCGRNGTAIGAPSDRTGAR
jgi:hypothetical protein